MWGGPGWRHGSHDLSLARGDVGAGTNLGDQRGAAAETAA